MDDKRKGEIALMFLKNKLRKDGIRLGQNTKRELGNTAKELGISTEEAVEFAEGLTRELVEEVFAK
jgi:hypothetical protein